MAGQGIGAFIGRGQKQGVQAVTHRQNVPFINPCRTASRLHVINVVMGKGDHFIQITFFQYDQGCKDLGDTGRIVGLVLILSI